jgi:hypothetical protein
VLCRIPRTFVGPNVEPACVRGLLQLGRMEVSAPGCVRVDFAPASWRTMREYSGETWPLALMLGRDRWIDVKGVETLVLRRN